MRPCGLPHVSRVALRTSARPQRRGTRVGPALLRRACGPAELGGSAPGTRLGRWQECRTPDDGERGSHLAFVRNQIRRQLLRAPRRDTPPCSCPRRTSRSGRRRGASPMSSSAGGGELDQTERFPAEIYARMAELGLFGITVADADGGAGADALAYALVMEELARGASSVADQCGLVELVGTLLAQRQRGPEGEVSRPAAARRAPLRLRHHGAGCRLRCRRDPHHGDADRARLAAGWRQAVDPQRAGLRFRGGAGAHRSRRGPPRHERVPGRARSAGLRGRRQGAQDGPVRLTGRGAALRWRRAAKDARLGPENRGFHMMMGVLDKGRVGIAALAVGILQAALEAAVDYAGPGVSSARRSRSSRACSGCSPTWPRTRRRRAA